MSKFYRIGGSSVEMLTPKSGELVLNPPGISILRAESPQQAAAMIRTAFGTRSLIGTLARTVGETTLERVRAAGFDLRSNPTNKFGDAHFRLIHPLGTSGFNHENLFELSKVFVDMDGL